MCITNLRAVTLEIIQKQHSVTSAVQPWYWSSRLVILIEVAGSHTLLEIEGRPSSQLSRSIHTLGLLAARMSFFLDGIWNDETIWRNFFLNWSSSSLEFSARKLFIKLMFSTTDGLDGNGCQIEKVWPMFSSSFLVSKRKCMGNNLLRLVLFLKIHLILYHWWSVAYLEAIDTWAGYYLNINILENVWPKNGIKRPPPSPPPITRYTWGSFIPSSLMKGPASQLLTRPHLNENPSNPT